MNIEVTYYECEHFGDLERYKQELCSAGARVIEENPDFDSEEVTFRIEVDNINAFLEKFRKTDSYDFAYFFGKLDF